MMLSAKRFFRITFLCSLAVLGAQWVFAQNNNEPAETFPAPAVSAPTINSSADRPARKTSDYDPLLDPPPLEKSPVSLIGGTVTAVDEIQNRITVKPFSGKQRLHMNFDARTHVFRDGVPASQRDLQAGQRVYLDTMLNSGKVFAKSIWIRKAVGSGSGRGQVIRYDSRANTVSVRDEVSAEPVNFRLDSATVIRKGDTNGTVEDLKPGALIAVSFDPGQSRFGTVREISLLAEPGSAFTFLGKVTFIDLSQKLIAVSNQSDDKNYDIYFESIPPDVLQKLQEGTQASISAVFDGSRYVAQKVDVIQK